MDTNSKAQRDVDELLRKELAERQPIREKIRASALYGSTPVRTKLLVGALYGQRAFTVERGPVITVDSLRTGSNVEPASEGNRRSRRAAASRRRRAS